MFKIIIIAVFLCIIIFIIIHLIKEENDYINNWAEKKGLYVVKNKIHIPIGTIPIGTPFYYCDKSQRIYEIHLSDGSLWWHRTCIFHGDGDWIEEK
jgi:hypothetical protein